MKASFLIKVLILLIVANSSFADSLDLKEMNKIYKKSRASFIKTHKHQIGTYHGKLTSMGKANGDIYKMTLGSIAKFRFDKNDVDKKFFDTLIKLTQNKRKSGDIYIEFTGVLSSMSGGRFIFDEISNLKVIKKR